MSSADPATIKNLLLLLSPVIVIEIGLEIAALVSVIRRPAAMLRWNNKLVWILLIVFINLFGPIAYFIFGRVDEPEEEGNV